MRKVVKVKMSVDHTRQLRAATSADVDRLVAAIDHFRSDTIAALERLREAFTESNGESEHEQTFRTRGEQPDRP